MPKQTEVRVSVGGRTLVLTNLERVLYPADHVTKAEVVQYYLLVADTMLPHLAGRCLTRIRYPHGVGDRFHFYEKNLPTGAPEWLGSQLVRTSESLLRYPVVTEAAELVYLANLASLEIHAPQWVLADATCDAEGAVVLDGPDQPRTTTLMIDLDPGDDVTMVDSAHAALLVGTALADLGLIPYVKTTGSKGLQVSAPIAPTRCDEVTAWAKAFSQRLVRAHPDRFVVTTPKEHRVGRILLDYLENAAARNAVCPYSLRAREHPSVATPVTWDEVAACREPDDLRFSPADVLERLDAHGDLFADLLTRTGPGLPGLGAGPGSTSRDVAPPAR